MLITGFVILLIGVSVFWILQFVNLMRMKSAEFPAPHDRLLWAAAFCTIFFAAPFAFIIWKMMAEPPDPLKPPQQKNTTAATDSEHP